jgi:hypothetical protein
MTLPCGGACRIFLPAELKQLAAELEGFERVMGVIGKVIQPA